MNKCNNNKIIKIKTKRKRKEESKRDLKIDKDGNGSNNTNNILTLLNNKMRNNSKTKHVKK